jgi:hypothetical protein
MALNPNDCKTFDREKAEANFFEQCKIPSIPERLNLWFEFSRSTLGMDLYLDDRHLDMSNVIDLKSMMYALEGCRFIQDRRLSSPDRLVWQDKVNTNEWNQDWIILCSTNADPIIADVSQNSIPVFQAYHGAGIWSPLPLFDSIVELIEHIKIEKKPELLTELVCWYTVNITNFGTNPKAVLLALKKMSAFSCRSNTDLLKLRSQLPLTLLENSVSKVTADRILRQMQAVGATIELISSYNPKSPRS